MNPDTNPVIAHRRAPSLPLASVPTARSARTARTPTAACTPSHRRNKGTMLSSISANRCGGRAGHHRRGRWSWRTLHLPPLVQRMCLFCRIRTTRAKIPLPTRTHIATGHLFRATIPVKLRHECVFTGHDATPLSNPVLPIALAVVMEAMPVSKPFRFTTKQTGVAAVICGTDATWCSRIGKPVLCSSL